MIRCIDNLVVSGSAEADSIGGSLRLADRVFDLSKRLDVLFALDCSGHVIKSEVVKDGVRAFVKDADNEGDSGTSFRESCLGVIVRLLNDGFDLNCVAANVKQIARLDREFL